MRIEMLKQWDKVLSLWSEVDEFSREGKLQEAVNSAQFAIFLASRAIRDLSQELKIPHLDQIAYNAWMELDEKTEKHYAPKEIIEWAYKTMKRLCDELPPDTFKPIR